MCVPGFGSEILSLFPFHVLKNSAAVPAKNQLLPKLPVPVRQMRIVNPGEVKVVLAKRLSGKSYHFQADALPAKLRHWVGLNRMDIILKFIVEARMEICYTPLGDQLLEHRQTVQKKRLGSGKMHGKNRLGKRDFVYEN